MSVLDAFELPGLVFDVYRLRDTVEGVPRMVTLVAALDGTPLFGVSRQSASDKEDVRMGVLVAMVKARPVLRARDGGAIIRHAFLMNGLPDPHGFDNPLEAVWDFGNGVIHRPGLTPSHRATIDRGQLADYLWLNGRYQVAQALCEARKMKAEKLHDKTMEYAEELGNVLNFAVVMRGIIHHLRRGTFQPTLAALRLDEAMLRLLGGQETALDTPTAP